MSQIKKCLGHITWLLFCTIYVLFGPSAVSAITNEDLGDILRKHPYYSDSAECTQQNVPGTVGSLDRFLQALAAQESGGNITADNPKSTASGKYQYLDGTWHSSAQNYYPPALQYAHAKDAPEAVQDAVAYIEYSKQFSNYQGDLFKLAVNHFYPKANTDPSLLDVDAPSNSITPREYANAFLDKIEKGEGNNIPLLYSQAPDFQKYLTQNGGTTDSTSINQTATTTSVDAGCLSQAPTGEFVFYSQYDDKWGDHSYGTSTIAESGCGPSSLAMVVATLVDKSVTPVEVADYATTQNYFDEEKGSSWDLFTDGPKHWGLSSEDLGTDVDGAIEFLRTGGLVIASGTGPVPFTDKGHIIVLRGVTPDGRILVGDPAHPEANESSYSTNQLSAYIKNMWGISK